MAAYCDDGSPCGKGSSVLSDMKYDSNSDLIRVTLRANRLTLFLFSVVRIFTLNNRLHTRKNKLTYHVVCGTDSIYSLTYAGCSGQNRVFVPQKRKIQQGSHEAVE
jgi:hypothetical protein